MADIIPIGCAYAQRLPHAAGTLHVAATTTDPDIIRLHGLAENALATALHCLRSEDCTPAQLHMATGRAVRAATLLKRASMAANPGVEV